MYDLISVDTLPYPQIGAAAGSTDGNRAEGAVGAESTYRGNATDSPTAATAAEVDGAGMDQKITLLKREPSSDPEPVQEENATDAVKGRVQRTDTMASRKPPPSATGATDAASESAPAVKSEPDT